MNKKGFTLWEIIVMAIVILIVGGVLLFAFNRLFGKETKNVEDQIDRIGDKDGDSVIDTFDKCDERPPAGAEVGSDGCTDAQRTKLK